MIRRIPTAILLIALAVLVAACGGDEKNSKDAKAEKAAKQAAADTDPFLVVNGQHIDPDGNASAPAVDPADARKAAAAADADEDDERPTTLRTTYTPPPLLSDGTIDEDDDPFGDGTIGLHPLPMEGNPETTREVDAFARGLRRIENEQWAQWIADSSPAGLAWGPPEVARSLVRVFTQRCGGARTVATGVVLGNDLIATTVHAIQSPMRRIRVQGITSSGYRIPAMIKYVDVDDDVAILQVPGLQIQPIGFHTARGADPMRALAYGVGYRGQGQGTLNRQSVYAAMVEESITLEQPDGLDQPISARPVFPIAGPIDTGMSGGMIAATNDADLQTGWAFHGLIRARVPFRSPGGGIAIPARVVRESLAAAEAMPEWQEMRPTSCPQWHRPRTP